MSCQRYDKGESGRIETPNFPASYRQGANCRWVIEGPLNSKIQVILFKNFKITSIRKIPLQSTQILR